MRNIFVLMCCFLLSANLVLANETVLLKGSVVKVPDTFFGSWRVVSKLVDTDSPISFKEKGVDLWNISLENNVIKLSNPFSGAVAELNVENTSSDSVTFTKEGKYDNKILTDKIYIKIEDNKFTGINDLSLNTISDIDGSIRKTETAKYSLFGEKISGQSIIDN